MIGFMNRRVGDSAGGARVAAWAAWAAMVAVGALVAVNLAVNVLSDSAEDVVRPIFAVVFMVGGVVALVLSARALRGGERGPVVWASLLVGVVATVLMVAELFFLE